MPHQKKNSHKLDPYNNQFNRINKEDDTYGIFKQEMEVDTDVNEDQNREKLLDESLESFLDSKKEQ
ncbi:hypothetical protein JOC86_004077 [Bacillus pakistanensis]|uniref:Uncharacterized protein n=1 Tax=Rossellomorea pakistanensis TaxID=992288 RepID=A0ABS2NI51_9BACI|nr:hypothetical protein [Bacillus pakistanensis]MBM7587504.1 hypothetical protein [Bacillus pakistanensis]